jgi:hypothetical protein
VRTQRPQCLLPDGAALWIGRVAFRVKHSSDDYRMNVGAVTEA